MLRDQGEGRRKKKTFRDAEADAQTEQKRKTVGQPGQGGDNAPGDEADDDNPAAGKAIGQQTGEG